MDKYILTESWGRPNIQKREYIAQDDKERDAMLAKGGIATGDKVYVIESKKTYMLGFDNKWYDATTGGAAPALENVTVSYTENNTYSITPSANYDGIAQVDVTVDVPSDPSLEVIDVTYLENGNFTIRPTAGIDGISQANVQVNVPAPAAIVEPKTVTLYDYDGTIITQYGAQEFANLQNYPAAPVHEGLTFQSWNWPLATAQQYVAKYDYCDIGATYCTSDGLTKLYLALKQGNDTMAIDFSLDGEGDIDWGDGTSTHIIGDDLEVDLSESHTYDIEGGYYIIKIGVTGTISLGGRDGMVVCQGYQSYGEVNLYKVEMASNAILGGNFYCEDSFTSAFTTIVISEGTTTIPYQAFASCSALKHITLPRTVTRIEDGAFVYVDSLQSISLSYQCNIDRNDSIFDSNYYLKRLVIPEGNTEVKSYNNCDYISIMTIPETVQTIISVPCLTSISIPSSVTRIRSLGGQWNSLIIPSTVNQLDGLGSIYLHSARIGAKYMRASFNTCYLLSDVTFMSSVLSIENSLFDEGGYYQIRNITFEGATPPTVTSATFEYLPTYCVIRVPQGTLSTYTSAENYPDPNEYTYEEYSV